ncbi:MAG TPA: 16S rRNA (uracil(1498)-N(3))-methyltransferase [Nevskiales bacterium]|nr:16S rRNA (uracil(1498)-N(3))-methyltransferase [Nevskiales bacterium]
MPKHIPRIYCESPLAEGGRRRLGEDVAHHLLHVLRLKPGAELRLFDGRGGEYAGRLAAAGKRWIEVEAVTHQAVRRESPLRIILGQAVSRGERMDYTLQKAVELGVESIQPLDTEHSQARLEPARLDRKLRHWREVARAAAEQSGRERLPEVHPPLTLAAWVSALPPAPLKLLLDPGAGQGLVALAPCTDICLLSGPEGGLSAAELAQAQQAGFTAIRLGPRILRTETAAVACLAALQALWGDLGS